MDLVLTEDYLPATLTARPMTDEEFQAFCAEHPDLFFEMTAEGDLVVMPPTGLLTGARNSEVTAQLTAWARKDSRGVATDSSTGFVLPNRARRSPDCAWTPKMEIKKAGEQNSRSFLHLCPAFVVDLRSQWDRLHALRAKMREYLDNGAELGWLIDADARAVEIYRPGREPERLENPEQVKGVGPVEGFVLELRTVWDPLA